MDLSSLPSLPYLLIFLLPVVLIGAFVASVANPRGVIDVMGFQGQSPAKTTDLFIYTFGVRELSLGVAAATLMAYNEWRAATILTACIGMNGISDFILDGSQGQGWWHAFKTHGVPTMAGYWAVWNLWQDL